MSGMQKLGCVLFALSVLPIGCGGAAPESDVSTPTDTLRILDTLTVADAGMILDVSSICYDSEGNTYFFDRVQSRIEKFDSHGAYVRSIGRRGEGPGEISVPGGFTVLGNDRLLVNDNGSMTSLLFSTEGDYLGAPISWRSSVPWDIHAMGDSSFVGTMLNVENGENGVSISFDVHRYTASSEPEVCYFSKEWNWSPETSHLLYEDIERILYTASPDNRFFIAPDAGEYLVQVCDSEGSLLHLLQRSDLQRVPKPDSIIDFEREVFEGRAAQDQGYTGGYSPDEYYPLIRSLGVDAQGNLWVQRGDSHPRVTFDVWAPDGGLLKSVVLADAPEEVIEKCAVGSGGITAFTEDTGDGMVLFSLGYD